MLSKSTFAIPIGLACFLSAAPVQADPSFADDQTWGFEIGFFAQGGYFFAPSLENLLGDRHQSGGGLLIAGFTGRFKRNR